MRGIDQVTGQTLHWVETFSARDSFDRRTDTVFRDLSTFNHRWVAPGPGNDLLITGRFVYVLNANGIVEVDRNNFETTCV